MTLTLSGREIDFRIAVLPVLHGENVVLRVLDRARGIVLLDSLGLSGAALHQLRLMLARPEGMVVVTGPTGSGKTTTLYSMLSHLNDVGVNIMTLEDPVEYPLPMVRQTPVNEAVKLDFASGIRALMRQDPDIILVGEIRDTETASMAFRAAMTGHQVFATLHTHSALGALARLADLGVLPDMMAGNISGVIGQRLVRVLCVQCKTASTPDDVEQRLLFLPNSPPPEMIFRPVGCPQCRGTGYRGRRTVMEVLRFDEEFDALVGSRAPLSAFRALVAQREVMPLADAAVALVRAGETALEEVLRVVDLTGRLAR
jgi:type II secretory ATPase GspE/PulE/Tfp pilus assembly ATPase PilB-like protein